MRRPRRARRRKRRRAWRRGQWRWHCSSGFSRAGGKNVRAQFHSPRAPHVYVTFETVRLVPGAAQNCPLCDQHQCCDARQQLWLPGFVDGESAGHAALPPALPGLSPVVPPGVALIGCEKFPPRPHTRPSPSGAPGARQVFPVWHQKADARQHAATPGLLVRVSAGQLASSGANCVHDASSAVRPSSLPRSASAVTKRLVSREQEREREGREKPGGALLHAERAKRNFGASRCSRENPRERARPAEVAVASGATVVAPGATIITSRGRAAA